MSASGDSDGNDDADAFTSQNGRYELEGLATGRYQIQFDPSCGGSQMAMYLGRVKSLSVRAGKTVAGFNAGSFAPQFYDNQPGGELATLIGFKAGKTARNIDAVMQPGGTVAGVVTNASGHRLSGVCGGAATHGQADLGLEVFTSIAFTHNGRHLMQNLPPNPYLIQFGCTGGRYVSQWFRSQPDSASADLVSVNPGVTTMASARLSLAGSIAGMVTNQAGHPLSRICVNVVDARDKIFVTLPGIPGLTAKAGRYVLGGLPPGRYLVQFTDCHLHARYGSQWVSRQDDNAVRDPGGRQDGPEDGRDHGEAGFRRLNLRSCDRSLWQATARGLCRSIRRPIRGVRPGYHHNVR